MPPKKKKEEEKKKEVLTNVDKTFYELQIEDLNRKLAHLRVHVGNLETRNEEIENEIKNLEQDRTDITGYLDKTMHDKISTIEELEEKITELAQVRETETYNFQKQIKEWEVKFKIMQEELTSEIKLLTGKLNSLEEFRIQKDDLMAKFDQQDVELKDKTRRHKEIMYEMERKQVVEKDRLKREVETKLLQLSNEFAKSNEIRISAHVQRLVRENIALNNELDRMMFSQRRLQKENEKLLQNEADRKGFTSTYTTENVSLIKSCDTQLKIIKKLTDETGVLKISNNKLQEAHRLDQFALSRDKELKEEFESYKTKVVLLEQKFHWLRTECDTHLLALKNSQAENKRLMKILKNLRFSVMSAIRGEAEPDDDERFRAAQRQNLLSELMNILISVEDECAIISSLDTIADSAYSKGDLGITPKESFNSLLKSTGLIQYDEGVKKEAESVEEEVEENADLNMTSNIFESVQIMDAESGSLIVFSESSKGEAEAPPSEGMEEAEDFGVSSSDDEQPPEAKQPVRENKSAVIEKVEIKEEKPAPTEVVITEEVTQAADDKKEEDEEDEEKLEDEHVEESGDGEGHEPEEHISDEYKNDDNN